jgi:hypothetical protein
MKHNGGNHDESARKPDEILAEIERTRHDMDSTLTAIEHRLTPGQLVDQGMDYLRNSGGNEFVHNLGGQVKNNPLPVAIVGIGLAWLMASSKNPPPQYASESSGPGLGERAGQMRDKVSGMASSASGLASSAKSRMSEGTQAMGERVRQVSDTLSSVGQSTRQRVSDLGGSARYQVDRARSGMNYMMREQPLALGAIGLAIGAVFAAMAPRTRKEDELMGDTRDRLLDQAKEAGKEKLEQAKDVANAAMSTATKEAEQRGLKPQPQAGKADSGKADYGKSDFSAKPTISPKPGPAMPSTSIGNPGGSGNLP